GCLVARALGTRAGAVDGAGSQGRAAAARADKRRSHMNANRLSATRPKLRPPGAPRRTSLLLALATACISGVAVFLNSYGFKAFGDATTYTTAKNIVATLVLVIAAMSASRHG